MNKGKIKIIKMMKVQKIKIKNKNNDSLIFK